MCGEQADRILWPGPDKETKPPGLSCARPRLQMTQLSEIYNQRILELSANIPLGERLSDPDATATAHSKLCGSTVTVDLKLEGDRVMAYGQTVKACLLGQSAASVMGQNIIGTSTAELREVVRHAPDAEGRRGSAGWPWADLQCSSRSRTTGAACLDVLVFDAVESALAKAEAKHGAGPPDLASVAATSA